ncbi:MAG: ribose 5-phosphate isomerase B [Nitrospinota bacterium]|jgi:ribose 5-phosphate isomerase B|nr:ribose 5-phosphate isomerase B [Nitrospinota bacterium]MDP6365041.1 ribose 5-phosphate isomerase B [Nitrospinota bacterium]MDP7169639.1 ribose 5-phosphate isomerase B [Nitrospinota bacterium]MDP7369919.1 ribose 5-phosphate isomerase B [Nitrospinota bacterium]MDP7503085.1 ribose 5-phosphate isomerase B [Nitrospinota bacterium]|tara:strand:+ start:385 stop:843 length:459 start_codon:yes stop_codon:yes gene_type:complete
MKPIAIASDHGGFAMKEAVKSVLEEANIPYKDYGTGSDESCDYPYYGVPAARSVSDGESARAILCCGSGAGMTIVANKFAGVRAVNCYDEWSTEMSRRHNDANVMALGGRSLDVDEAKRLIRLWLDTPFEEGRHARRVSKIAGLEQSHETAI